MFVTHRHFCIISTVGSGGEGGGRRSSECNRTDFVFLGFFLCGFVWGCFVVVAFFFFFLGGGGWDGGGMVSDSFFFFFLPVYVYKTN